MNKRKINSWDRMFWTLRNSVRCINRESLEQCWIVPVVGLPKFLQELSTTHRGNHKNPDDHLRICRSHLCRIISVFRKRLLEKDLAKMLSLCGVARYEPQLSKLYMETQVGKKQKQENILMIFKSFLITFCGLKRKNYLELSGSHGSPLA